MQSDDLANSQNVEYVEQLYQQYRRDPRSVPAAWHTFFAGFELGLARADAAKADAGKTASAPAADQTNRGSITVGVFDVVHSYRELGHFIAILDPLGHSRSDHPLLHLDNFNLAETDLDRQVGRGGFQGQTDGSLRDLIEKLRLTYCRTIGVEFIGISDKTQRDWLLARMEPIHNQPVLTAQQAREIHFQLVAAQEFEQFLQQAYPGKKRFSIEGGEALIPLLNTIIDHGATIGLEQLIMSMAHRGRLNVLAHVLNKPYEVMLSEFQDTALPLHNVGGDGDVKYHLGFANERKVDSAGGIKVKISLLPNPSHLELIDPLQQGIVRCKQEILDDRSRSRVVPVCIHGDAAFTGQGIVAETLSLSELPGYGSGGTIHIILNNQIGFTTPPSQERFTPYPTDVAKAIQAPIFHVNGDDPEAVVHAAKLAIEFRQQFKCDVMIDLWCYRKYGHNEQDVADFTQPVMYAEIAQHRSVRELYAKRLLADGHVTEPQLQEMREVVIKRIKDAREASIVARPRLKVPSFSGVWKGLGRAGADWSAKTNVPRPVLSRIAQSQKNLPADFTPHPKLIRLLDNRVQAVENGRGIDWGCAEMLAIGSLLLEGTPVRLTGEDTQRGTFSHRHAVLHDYENGKEYVPLSHLDPAQANFTVLNTMLSELAVLGFEWGYASADPRNLVVWEAQFGDFVNNAQPIIDQVIASTESKWHYMNGLVLLLPHGYEGNGPDHSNAYLERFLSLCAEKNMQVVVPSLPGQYFHALRRQIHRRFRKPLVLMMPKSLLRDTQRSSVIEEFTDGTFRLVIDDAKITDPDAVRRVLLCSGKVYWSLAEARDRANCQNVAIVRVEQLYPFPQDELETIMARYRRKQDVCWVQEESMNRGAWTFIEPRLRALLPDTILSYVGRDEAASPATGSHSRHEEEERRLVAAAVGVPKTVPPVGPGTPATAPSPTSVSK
jgi:2-oxoglutarate dehydrogenase E1 component